jgi:hypothetical protein
MIDGMTVITAATIAAMMHVMITDTMTVAAIKAITNTAIMAQDMFIIMRSQYIMGTNATDAVIQSRP